jgi:hypothetical protein
MSETLLAIDEAINSADCDPLAAAKVRALLYGYHDHWQSSQFEVVAVEETFQLPIVNPETGRASRTFTQGGRFDLRVNFDAKHWMVEHKSCNEEIADPSAPYWRRLAIDSQVSMYALANWQNGSKLDGTIYDVIRKPTIRPKQITKADTKTMVEAGTYCGFNVTHAEIAASAAIDYSETPGLYGLRLYRDCLDNPTKYYQRRPVPRLDNEILEWSGELWQVAQDIRQTQLSGGHYRNSGACMNFGRPCDFLGICSGYDTPDSDKWRQRESAHPEVALDTDTITHSRIRCYQTCKRMHHYKYDLKLERVDDESAEALVFGQLLHKALEGYFLFLKETQDEYRNSCSAAAIEVASGQKALAF